MAATSTAERSHLSDVGEKQAKKGRQHCSGLCLRSYSVFNVSRVHLADTCPTDALTKMEILCAYDKAVTYSLTS